MTDSVSVLRIADDKVAIRYEVDSDSESLGKVYEIELTGSVLEMGGSVCVTLGDTVYCGRSVLSLARVLVEAKFGIKFDVDNADPPCEIRGLDL